MNWLAYALITVASWGLYGAYLHQGQVAMGDPENGRYKAFLFVGLAYFLTAVLAPLIMLSFKETSWLYPVKGVGLSLFAGILGAVGAFSVLLAFGAKGSPAVVMSIVFAGAPVVNAMYSIISHPPAGGWGGVKWQFYLGIAMAAAGGCLVTFYKPTPAPKKPQTAQVQTQAAVEAQPEPVEPAKPITVKVLD